MKRSTFSAILVLLVALSPLGSTAIVAQVIQVPIDALTNVNLRTYSGGSNYPVGPVDLSVGGTSFSLLPLSGVPNSLGALQAPPGMSSFSIPTNVVAPTAVYTLANSQFGTFGANIATIQFVGAGGATASFDYIEGTNMRDHLDDGFNNIIAPGTPSIEFGLPPALVRFDRQTFVMPPSFATDTLTQIIFSGHGGSPAGNAFLAAITVDTTPIPEPSSLGLLLSVTASAAAVWRRRYQQNINIH